MAITAVMLFKSDKDVQKIYDAVIDEMGVRDNPPDGAIYHWCAPVKGGMLVCDMWETRDRFERFSKEKIGPITAKHGLQPPELEIAPVHEFIRGRATDHKGTGLFIEFDGDTQKLLGYVDDINEGANIAGDPPAGLIIHWSMPGASGIRVIDHWRSRQDFDKFVQTRLGPAMQSLNMPQPRITSYEVYNTIDPRVAAKI